MVNWNDPASRAAYAESVGPDAYNAAAKKHAEDTTICTVNGRAIRPVMSRFGKIYMVEGTGTAYFELTKAKFYASSLPAI